PPMPCVSFDHHHIHSVETTLAWVVRFVHFTMSYTRSTSAAAMGETTKRGPGSAILFITYAIVRRRSASAITIEPPAPVPKHTRPSGTHGSTSGQGRP